MATVLGAGVGIWVLSTLWVITILCCLIFSQAKGGAKFIGIAVFVIALVITIVLIVLPKGESAAASNVIYDELIILRYVFIVLGALCVLGGLIAMIISTSDPILAKPLKES